MTVLLEYFVYRCTCFISVSKLITECIQMSEERGIKYDIKRIAIYGLGLSLKY